MNLIFYSILNLYMSPLVWTWQATSFLGTKVRTQLVYSDAPPTLLSMKDNSASTWFKIGDKVQVVDDVIKAEINLRGRTGYVMEAWEKCDVDPTCCCAEQVECDLAVRVRFNDQLEHYFAEEELQVI